MLAHPQAREAGWPNVMHMAFCATALADSGMRLFDDAAGSPVSGFEAGYASWREKHLAGEAGVFTLPLGAAYAAVTSVANGPSRG
ncbi:hypothetical protein [Oceanicella sp. SM1341]|uniref:hypothetical protein n=1 Tax=Oceanicella sp. SM1341 TaxID=1548889 RepID=UPI000E4DFAA5|nr:hypothetical protein [Oceanicella sp. SM1341]